jgi:hypothetical protein
MLLPFSFSDTQNPLAIIQRNPPIRYVHVEQPSLRHKTRTCLHRIQVWIATMASTKPGYGRAALDSMNAPNTEKSLLWCYQTTIRIQIFSNLAKEQSPLEEVTFSNGLCFFARLLFLGGLFLAVGSEQVRW